MERIVKFVFWNGLLWGGFIVGFEFDEPLAYTFSAALAWVFSVALLLALVTGIDFDAPPLLPPAARLVTGLALAAYVIVNGMPVLGAFITLAAAASLGIEKRMEK